MISRILIVAKDITYQQMLSGKENRYQLVTVKNPQNMEPVLLIQNIDLVLILLDDNFSDAIQGMEQIKKDLKYYYLPFIFIETSSVFNNQSLEIAFKAGVSDYLKSDCNENELISRIEYQISNYKRLKELEIENSTSQETLKLMDKLVLLMDKADNSFVLFDSKGEIEWVNDGFIRLYGYSIEEFKKKCGTTIFEASKNIDIKSKVEQCIQTKKSVNYVAECITQAGEFKWVQTTFTPILGKDGSIEKFIAIESDITKLKEAEEALNQKNEYMIALTNHLKSSNALLEEQQKEINTQNIALKAERKKADDLLLNILPFEVWRQLKSKGEVKPRSFKLATVLFLDFVNFSTLSKELAPKDLINILDSFFTAFDEIVEKLYIEKIKTIGDAYMCAGGLPLSNRSNPIEMVLAGLELQSYVKNNQPTECIVQGFEWQSRIGIDTGEVISGVVGKRKFIYDIWGNTVNMAYRMQEESEKGRVNISQSTYEHVKDYFICKYRGKIKIKGNLLAHMYFVDGIKPEYAADELGIFPNELFKKIINTL